VNQVVLLAFCCMLAWGRGELGGVNFGIAKLIYEQNGKFEMKLPSGEVFNFEDIADRPLEEQVHVWNTMAKKVGLPLELEHSDIDPSKEEEVRLKRKANGQKSTVESMGKELTGESPRGDYIRTQREFEDEMHHRIVSQTGRQEHACKKGSAKDCLIVGKHYFIGMTGKERDLAKAYHYLEHACRLGEGRGCFYLGRLAQNNVVRARYYGKACKKGYAGACAEVGILYLQGRDTSIAYHQARYYLEQGCKMNDWVSCIWMEAFSLLGMAGEVDEKKAAYYRQKAIKIREHPWKY